MIRSFASAVLFLLLLAFSTPTQASSNLVLNASFDNPTNHMAYWMYDYTWLGNGLYMNNHNTVEWLESEGGRKSVVKLYGTQTTLIDLGQGIWLDSCMIPYEYPYRYKVSIWARTDGPDARIFVRGAMWQGGIKPHPDATLQEMAPRPPNALYQQGSGHLVYFSGRNNRDTSGVKRTWTKGETIFPDDDPSEEGLKRLKKVDFIYLHICALMGSEGNLFVDEISIEKTDQKFNTTPSPGKTALSPSTPASKPMSKPATTKKPSSK